MTDTANLAQVNIARMVGPLESPVMAGFVARLEEINALADLSPGFVWRLQTVEGDATAISRSGKESSPCGTTCTGARTSRS